MHDTPAGAGAVRPWTRLDGQQAEVITAARLRQLAKPAYLGRGWDASPVPPLAATCPSAAAEADPMGIPEFYTGLAALGGVSPARAREQVRGVFAALIEAAGAEGMQHLVGRLHDQLTDPAGGPGIGEKFLAKVCRHGRFRSSDEAARVARATLTLLAARIHGNQTDHGCERES